MCRHIFANQHKLRKLFQQNAVRAYCSGTARLQEAILEDEPFQPPHTVAPHVEHKWKPVVHDDDVGRQFKVTSVHVRIWRHALFVTKKLSISLFIL